MSKFVLGGILAAISLLVIYGASASNRLASWVDRDRPVATPSNTDQDATSNSSDSLLALNAAETSDDSLVDISGMTPLEKAGTLPQRQTIGAVSDFGGGTPAAPNTDDTDGEVVTPNPQEPETPNDTAANTPTTPAPAPAPIRALW